VLSPLIGMVVGALVTLVLIILVVAVRVRRERVAKPRHEKPAELSELPPQQYPLQNSQQTVETDPDVIPNKFGKTATRSRYRQTILLPPRESDYDRLYEYRGKGWLRFDRRNGKTTRESHSDRGRFPEGQSGRHG